MTTNRKMLLAQRPVGVPTKDCFELVEDAVPDAEDGEAIVEVAYLSIDPTIRGWLNDEEGYLPPIQLGEVVRSGIVGTVVASKTDMFPVGMKVTGLGGWQQYLRIGGSTGALVMPLADDIELLDAVSVFGITGITAFVGIFDIGQVQAGDVFVVSGAAGGVGSIAGQIAKILGCRVVGIAGTDEKCAWLVDDLGFDAAINYKTHDVPTALRDACPNGIDVYFDNVGGDILNAALDLMNLNGRIIACGMISQYNDTERPPGPSNIFRIVGQRLRMQGFILLDHIDRFGAATEQLSQWVKEGKLQNRVTIVDGLEEAPRALNMLFTGENIGKVAVRV
ncbi:MAG TPA: NADP-dependent oxidoreductase [Acidimicrobiia bacterium]|nr:NADP-dependent oxidoreductase [Acidimicrobiia bacterium]